MAFTMMRLARLAGALALAASCAGCVLQWGQADRDASVRSPSDAYVVIGVAPEATSISLFQGTISDGGFRQNPLPPASFVGFPEDGFVVTRVQADTAYAITFVNMYASKSQFINMPFVPCRGAKTLAFSVPAGTVVYAGSMNYRRIQGGAIPEFRYDFDTATAYMNAHYPKLAPNLTKMRPQFLPVSGNKCVGD